MKMLDAFTLKDRFVDARHSYSREVSQSWVDFETISDVLHNIVGQGRQGYSARHDRVWSKGKRAKARLYRPLGTHSK